TGLKSILCLDFGAKIIIGIATLSTPVDKSGLQPPEGSVRGLLHESNSPRPRALLTGPRGLRPANRPAAEADAWSDPDHRRGQDVGLRPAQGGDAARAGDLRKRRSWRGRPAELRLSRHVRRPLPVHAAHRDGLRPTARRPPDQPARGDRA